MYISPKNFTTSRFVSFFFSAGLREALHRLPPIGSAFYVNLCVSVNALYIFGGYRSPLLQQTIFYIVDYQSKLSPKKYFKTVIPAAALNKNFYKIATRLWVANSPPSLL